MTGAVWGSVLCNASVKSARYTRPGHSEAYAPGQSTCWKHSTKAAAVPVTAVLMMCWPPPCSPGQDVSVSCHRLSLAANTQQRAQTSLVASLTQARRPSAQPAKKVE